MSRPTTKVTEIGKVYRLVKLNPSDNFYSSQFKDRIQKKWEGSLCLTTYVCLGNLNNTSTFLLFEEPLIKDSITSNMVYFASVKLKPVSKKVEAYFINHLKQKGLLK